MEEQGTYEMHSQCLLHNYILKKKTDSRMHYIPTLEMELHHFVFLFILYPDNIRRRVI